MTTTMGWRRTAPTCSNSIPTGPAADFRLRAAECRGACDRASDRRAWGSVNERDGWAMISPTDYITRIRDGGFTAGRGIISAIIPIRCITEHIRAGQKVIVPDMLLQAHSASLCMTFYTAKQFPAKYRGWAFAAEHGSWNRARRTGYKVICVPVKSGEPQGEYDDFMTGFVVDDGHVWGRPVGVTIDKQGSLIVVDDGSRSIWRRALRRRQIQPLLRSPSFIFSNQSRMPDAGDSTAIMPEGNSSPNSKHPPLSKATTNINFAALAGAGS